MPASTRALKTTEYTTQLLDKFERDRGDKHELQRNNYLNETVSTLNTMDIFKTTNSIGYSVPIWNLNNANYLNGIRTSSILNNN